MTLTISPLELALVRNTGREEHKQAACDSRIDDCPSDVSLLTLVLLRLRSRS